MPFWCFSGISLFLWGLIYLYVPETEGKTLEEIQLELRKGTGVGSKGKTTTTTTSPFLVVQQKAWQDKEVSQEKEKPMVIARDDGSTIGAAERRY